ncbi:MAG: hypothetical protein HUU48_06410 [Flavobacteriales bacterium]|nr:hypothetical protein [Flavobacteriales bacterium]
MKKLILSSGIITMLAISAFFVFSSNSKAEEKTKKYCYHKRICCNGTNWDCIGGNCLPPQCNGSELEEAIPNCSAPWILCP